MHSQDFDTSRYKVLCVDDEAGILNAVERDLKALGITMTKATSGSEALAQLDGRGIDIMICDASMPGMGGIELMRRVSDFLPSISKILLTANANDSDVLGPAIAECGVFRVVPKPWNPVALRLSVVEALGFSAAQWESESGQTLDRVQAA